MRARNIKPGFFSNEDLAECSPWSRLCFAGLWLLADRGLGSHGSSCISITPWRSLNPKCSLASTLWFSVCRGRSESSRRPTSRPAALSRHTGLR